MLLQEPLEDFHSFTCLTYLENVAHDDTCYFDLVFRLSQQIWDGLEHFMIFFHEIKVNDCLWITVPSMQWIFRI
jgi:hypothetical protein